MQFPFNPSGCARTPQSDLLCPSCPNSCCWRYSLHSCIIPFFAPRDHVIMSPLAHRFRLEALRVCWTGELRARGSAIHRMSTRKESRFRTIGILAWISESLFCITKKHTEVNFWYVWLIICQDVDLRARIGVTTGELTVSSANGSLVYYGTLDDSRITS